MNRKEILDAALQAITTDRQSDYGTPENSFSGIADYWNLYLSQREGPIKPHEVGIMLLLMKVKRSTVSPAKADSYVDMAGYAGCAGEIASAAVQPELPGMLTGNPLHDMLIRQADEHYPVDAAAEWAATKSDPHYPFYIKLKNGGRVWRNDRLNNVFEWLTLEHPSIAGKAENVRLFGYSDLSDAPAAFPPPPEGREWHNPDGLTPEQVGVAEGWRLCLKEELVTGELEWFNKFCWCNDAGAKYSTNTPICGSYTYRTKAPLP